tara:strand:+ start:714 stop:890 length:177 start_codon:yes stop_codon:yes gene_type:complete
MTTGARGRVTAMREFSSTPEKPITNKELLDFKRSDSKGFDELADLVVAELEKQKQKQE